MDYVMLRGSRCNRDDRSIWEGLYPTTHPDKIGICFAQGNMPFILLVALSFRGLCPALWVYSYQLS
jgi:hypothetical protein